VLSKFVEKRVQEIKDWMNLLKNFVPLLGAQLRRIGRGGSKRGEIRLMAGSKRYVIGRLESSYPGMEVDVRDENYVWRKGRIVRTLNKITDQRIRVKYLVVEYFENEKRE
jgi:hypothetical protein